MGFLYRGLDQSGRFDGGDRTLNGRSHIPRDAQEDDIVRPVVCTIIALVHVLKYIRSYFLEIKIRKSVRDTDVPIARSISSTWLQLSLLQFDSKSHHMQVTFLIECYMGD